jgi:hypothetical protein
LGARDMRRDAMGVWFNLARAKTGRAAIATLSKRSARLLGAYIGLQGAEPVGVAPVFRNRSGALYSKDTLGDDFRAVRAMVFGPAEGRQLADFRRSGAVEALSGDVPPAKLASKMANTLSASNRLHKTYARRGWPMCAMLMRQESGDGPDCGNKTPTKVSPRRPGKYHR